MKLKCKKEAINVEGQKILNFTKGKFYEFEESDDDLEGWKTEDDNGQKEVFFNLEIMFETQNTIK